MNVGGLDSTPESDQTPRPGKEAHMCVSRHGFVGWVLRTIGSPLKHVFGLLRFDVEVSVTSVYGLGGRVEPIFDGPGSARPPFLPRLCSVHDGQLP